MKHLCTDEVPSDFAAHITMADKKHMRMEGLEN
jgi:hypothetical protein